MTTFQETVKERKALVPSSRKKKSGAKSKYVSLPHDNVRPETLNGPVKKFNIDAPMTWTEFKTLEDGQKKLYVEHLQELYRPSWRMFADMFEMSKQPIVDAFNKLGISNLYPPRSGARPTLECRLKWQAFCNGVVGGGKKPEEAVRDILDDGLASKMLVKPEQAVVMAEAHGVKLTPLSEKFDGLIPRDEFTTADEITSESEPKKEMLVDVISFSVSGPFDVARLDNTLLALIPNGTPVKIHISCEKIKEDV